MSLRPGPVRWEAVTALFGGTFDPPHLGHRAAVQGLFATPGISRVLVIPSPSPPHKPPVAPVQDRVAMTRLAFAPSRLLPLPGPVDLDLCEIERGRLRPSVPAYTFDTLLELGRQIPQLAFVIGADQLQKLPTWHRFPEVLSLAHWIVLERKTGYPKQDLSAIPSILTEWEASSLVRREGPGWRLLGRPPTGVSSSHPAGTFIQAVPTDAPALSSTLIRENLARTGTPIEGSLSPEVLAYLMQRHLYGTKDPITAATPPRSL